MPREAWREVVLYSFNGALAANPYSGLILDGKREPLWNLREWQRREHRGRRVRTQFKGRWQLEREQPAAIYPAKRRVSRGKPRGRRVRNLYGTTCWVEHTAWESFSK